MIHDIHDKTSWYIYQAMERERYHDIDYFAWFCMVLHGIAILLPTFCRLPADASVLQCTDGQVEIVLLDLWLQVPVGTIRPTDDSVRAIRMRFTIWLFNIAMENHHF